MACPLLVSGRARSPGTRTTGERVAVCGAAHRLLPVLFPRGVPAMASSKGERSGSPLVPAAFSFRAVGRPPVSARGDPARTRKCHIGWRGFLLGRCPCRHVLRERDGEIGRGVRCRRRASPGADTSHLAFPSYVLVPGREPAAGSGKGQSSPRPNRLLKKPMWSSARKLTRGVC